MGKNKNPLLYIDKHPSDYTWKHSNVDDSVDMKIETLREEYDKVPDNCPRYGHEFEEIYCRSEKSDLSKQRGGYIVAGSPENPEKERRKKKTKNKFFNRVLRGLAASLAPCICF